MKRKMKFFFGNTATWMESITKYLFGDSCFLPVGLIENLVTKFFPKDLHFSTGYYEIDLQLFAAADEGRTEPPSERRRREEKEKGNVPKSNEVASTLVLLGGTGVLFVLGDTFIRNTAIFIKKYLPMGMKLDRFGAEEFRVILAGVSRDFFNLLWPILAITLVFAIVGNVVQVGFMFSPRALSFRFDRISPNFKRVLPNRQTLFNLVKSLAKVVLIGVISYVLISGDFLKVLLTGNMGMMQAITLITYSGFKIMMAAGLLLLGIAVADFFSKSLNLKNLSNKHLRKQNER